MLNGSIETAEPLNLVTNVDDQDADKGVQKSIFPRSASYTQLPAEEESPYVPQRRNSLRRSFSENVLTSPDSIQQRRFTHDAFSDPAKTWSYLQRRNSAKRRPSNHDSDSNVTISQFTLGPEESEESAENEMRNGKETTTSDRQKLKRSLSGSISKLARRSWVSASRSPSPSPQRKESMQMREVRSSAPFHQSKPLKDYDEKMPNGHVKSTGGPQAHSLRRQGSFLGRIPRRPLSALLSKGQDASSPIVPPVPKSFSTERLPSLSHKASIVGVPAVPRTPSFERLQNPGTETPRKKDDLWGAFRSLDAEYHKFQSRPSSTKTAVVRSTLLPFLRTYSEHPSISSLRPEDLDRRTVILNKWWTGLLGMLNGRHGESVSGNDRPAVLEAVTALMTRPEWTASPSRQSKTAKASLKSRSTTSLGSNVSDFLADSVFHNVKNTFTQNLLAQMTYVVDKMSTRNVAASVVTFCGRATAYAFFYCEGVADILVRLWNVPSRTIRRITSQFGHKSPGKDSNVSACPFSAFPSYLQPLSFQGLKSMMIYLKSRPHLPIATSYIPWHGPWVGRWAGRDTDLFYVFVKFYIDLACRLLPDSTTSEAKLAVPGWALVHAQLLTILNATLQRANAHPGADPSRGAPPTAFNEILGEADAAATLLPLPANGSYRSMAENRLIMLLRDCLSGANGMGEKVQSVFADSFEALLKAGASGTSVYDHNACFTLCDFLEEAIVILNRYRQGSSLRSVILDWPFWLKVYQRFLESQNSMTEVRLIAFIFSTWSTLANDSQRRRDICVGWLLEWGTFHRQFNHWCPMVRAFYMRLLVWRVGRLDASGSQIDSEILDLMHRRLKESYCYFLHLQNSAQDRGMARLSTAPCSPAPGRCLLIVRDDVQPAPSGMFLTFEGILSSTTTNKANPYEVHSSRDLLSGGIPPSDSKQPLPASKRRWGLFKSIVPFSSASEETKYGGPSSPGSAIALPHRSNGNTRNSDNPAKLSGDMRTEDGQLKEAPASPHMALSFKFSLEWMDKEDSGLGKDKDLSSPELPFAARLSMKKKIYEPSSYTPTKPEGAALGPSKYAGRALAEWAALIAECQNFFDRRRVEGVPSYHLVETPMLSVDPFRKI